MAQRWRGNRRGHNFSRISRGVPCPGLPVLIAIEEQNGLYLHKFRIAPPGLQTNIKRFLIVKIDKDQDEIELEAHANSFELLVSEGQMISVHLIDYANLSGKGLYSPPGFELTFVSKTRLGPPDTDVPVLLDQILA